MMESQQSQQSQQSQPKQQLMQSHQSQQSQQSQPKGGWNPSFTDKDKTEYADLYIYIKQFHTDIIADIMAQMIIYKRKYHLKYSEEQEQKIVDLFTR